MNGAERGFIEMHSDPHPKILTQRTESQATSLRKVVLVLFLEKLDFLFAVTNKEFNHTEDFIFVDK